MTNRMYTGSYDDLALDTATLSISEGSDPDGLYRLCHVQFTCYCAHATLLA